MPSYDCTYFFHQLEHAIFSHETRPSSIKIAFMFSFKICRKYIGHSINFFRYILTNADNISTLIF